MVTGRQGVTATGRTLAAHLIELSTGSSHRAHTELTPSTRPVASGRGSGTDRADGSPALAEREQRLNESNG